MIFNAPAMAQKTGQPLIQIKKHKNFSLPIECTIDEDCWVMNYVDMKPDDDLQTDPACLSRTYDGHKGTDIAILDEKTMIDGVNVLAPLEGTVTKIRDGEEDKWADTATLEKIKAERKECGNAILIDHGDNLQSIYCHLKKGSITVKPNQKVKQGDVIGQVGLSGMTEFPHLHFGITQDSQIIDPFTGQNNMGQCGQKIKSLWAPDLEISYQPFTIQNLGFSNDLPDLALIERNGEPPSEIKQDSDLLAFWVTFFGVREGDKITLEIKDPNGKVFARREIIQDKTRARQFYYIGLKTSRNPLREGAYTGEAKIERDYKGQPLSKEKFTAVLVTQ